MVCDTVSIFFITQRRYAWMSNFHPHPMVVMGQDYGTVEHAFQAAKCIDPEDAARIRMSLTPRDAKRIGRSVTLRDDWEQIKIPTMHYLLSLKFSDPEYRRLLHDTRMEHIYEDSHWDNFWGTGVSGQPGSGHNWMGRLLMEVRNQ